MSYQHVVYPRNTLKVHPVFCVSLISLPFSDEISHSPDILMTGLPITFTCKCTGTEAGCGTLQLTDTVDTAPVWTTEEWNEVTSSITGTGTITFLDSDKGSKTFYCGSDTSDSTVESVLDVVG